MADYGIGLGAFMDGLSKSAQLAYGLRRQQELDEERRDERAYQRKRDAQADARQARLDEESRRMNELRMREAQLKLDEYQADSENRDLERQKERETLRTDKAVQDAAKEGAAAGEAAYNAQKATAIRPTVITDGRKGEETVAPAFQVEGRTYKTKEEADKAADEFYGDKGAFMAAEANRRHYDALLRAGRVEDAEKFKAWTENSRIQDATRRVGAVQAAFQRGDWEGVDRNLKSLLKNRSYLDLKGQGMSVRTEVLRDGQGKATGIRAYLKQEGAGSPQVLDFTNIEEMERTLMGIINPVDVHDSLRKQLDAAEQAKGALATERMKAGVEIEKKKKIRDLGLDEKEGKSEGERRADIANSLRETRPNWARLSEEERRAEIDKEYAAVYGSGPSQSDQGDDTSLPPRMTSPSQPSQAAPEPAVGRAAPAPASQPTASPAAAPAQRLDPYSQGAAQAILPYALGVRRLISPIAPNGLGIFSR